MKYNVTETPDNWVVLKIPDGFKVFATWAGGYLDGDSWKINSGIKEVEEDESYYYFIGFSGSCYKCHKKGYGVITSYGQTVLDRILDMRGVQLMNEDIDWMSLINKKTMTTDELREEYGKQIEEDDQWTDEYVLWLESQVMSLKERQ